MPLLFCKLNVKVYNKSNKTLYIYDKRNCWNRGMVELAKSGMAISAIKS